MACTAGGSMALDKIIPVDGKHIYCLKHGFVPPTDKGECELCVKSLLG